MLTNLRRFRFLLYAAMIVIAVILRIAAFSPGLEYDEIWTIRNYSVGSISAILNDLATPNNHPLNSLAVRGMLFFSASAKAVRLPALLSGIAAVLLAGWLAWLIFRSRFIMFSTMFLTAVNPGLVFYSVIARGYSMQTALILLFALLAALAYRTGKTYPLILLPFSAVLAELVIPTSVLWLFPIALIHGTAELIRHGKNLKKIIPCAVSYGVTGLLLLGWILLHYHDFKAGQSFGRSVLSPSLFAEFIRNDLDALLCMGPTVSLLFCILPGLLSIPDKFGRKRLFGLLFLLFFPAGMALITLAGPERVYLPSVPFFAMTIGVLLYKTMRLVRHYVKRKPVRLILYLIPAVLPAAAAFAETNEGGKYWNRIDWIEKFQEYRRMPPEYFFCLQAVDAYPALFNNGKEILEDYLIRLGNMRTGGFFVMPDASGVISGMRKDGSTLSAVIPGRDKPLTVSDGTKYRVRILKPCSGGRIPGIALLRMNGISPDLYREAVQAAEGSSRIGRLLLLNGFFTGALQRGVQGNRLFGVLLLETKSGKGSQEIFRRFHEEYRGKFDFFELSE